MSNRPATEDTIRTISGANLGIVTLLREGMQLTGATIGKSNASGGSNIGDALGGIAPIAGYCNWVESISMHSAIDVFVWVQRANGSLIANGASSSMNPVAVGPTYGCPIIPVNSLIPEGETISFILRTAVPTGGGTDTFQFRAGLNGRRITNDLAFEAPKVWLVIGDSITCTTGVSYGSEYYHAVLARRLKSDGKHYRRIVKGDGAWKSSHALHLQKRGQMDVPRAELITYMLGTNESLLTDFQANLPQVLSWKQEVYPRSRLVVLGPPPRQDSVETSLLQPLRSYAQSAIAALDDPLINYTSLGAAFSPSGDTYYFTADGTTSGTRVHPNALGHTAMADTLETDLSGSGLWAEL